MEISLADYLQKNYVLLVMLLGIFVVHFSSRRLSRVRTERVMPFVGLGVLLISVLQYFADYYESLPYPTFGRRVLLSVCYMIYPLLLFLVLLTITKKEKRKKLVIPLLVNTAYSVLLLFNTVLTTHFTETNEAVRGYLGIIPFVVNYLYLAMMIYNTRSYFREHRAFRRNLFLFVAIALAVTSLLSYYRLIRQLNTVGVFCIFMCILYFTITRDANTQRELLLADMQLYQRQIRPHFIYNGLGVIRSRLAPGESEAKDVLDHFTRYLRGNADILTVTGLIPSEKEFDIVENYLYMERMRFEDSLTVEVDIRDSGYRLPAFTVQILVENAVRHGIRKKPDGVGTLRLSTWLEGKNHVIEVRDDGVGFDVHELRNLWETENRTFDADPPEISQQKPERSHIGLINLRKRLEILCGGRLIIDSTPGKGTIAKVLIPVELEDKM